MLADERRSMILEVLNAKGSIKVNDIAKRFDVTVETARRDIAALQEKKLAKKVYGGAVSIDDPIIKDSLYSAREVLYTAEKAAIGKLAASIVGENSTVFLGSGTTTLEIAKNLKHKSNVTVITNSIPVVLELMGTEISTFCIGGKVGGTDMNMTGSFSIIALKNFYDDYAFITGLGITLNTGVTCYSPEESTFAKEVKKQASKTILVMDSSKFGQNSLVVQGKVNDYDEIITDSNIAPQQLEEFKNHDIDLLIAGV